jgi:hypothetical protein
MRGNIPVGRDSGNIAEKNSVQSGDLTNFGKSKFKKKRFDKPPAGGAVGSGSGDMEFFTFQRSNSMKTNPFIKKSGKNGIKKLEIGSSKITKKLNLDDSLFSLDANMMTEDRHILETEPDDFKDSDPSTDLKFRGLKTEEDLLQQDVQDGLFSERAHPGDVLETNGDTEYT